MKKGYLKNMTMGLIGFALATTIIGATIDTGGLGTQMVVVVDEKAANTAGGTCTSGSWQTRDLNTLIVNDDTIASVSGNQVTLPAGTYECWISAPAYAVNGHMIRLEDITGTATIETGTSQQAGTTVNASSRSFVLGKFTLGVSSALEVQHRCATTKATTGFGVANNFGVVETYTIAMFRKVN